MAITFTTKGSATTDGTTATVSSLATVNGRLYAVCGAGVSNNGGGANYYDSLVATTTGPSTTLRAYQRSYASQTPLASIYTFVGTGSTIDVTVTQGNAAGSPTYPVTAINVIEVTGSASVDRSNTANVDVGSGGGWNTSLTITGSAVTNAKVLGVISTTYYSAAGTMAPNGSETEIADAYKAHGSGAGFSGSTTGSNINWQTESYTTLTLSWAATQDENRTSIVMLEFLPSAVNPAVLITGRYTPGVANALNNRR